MKKYLVLVLMFLVSGVYAEDVTGMQSHTLYNNSPNLIGRNAGMCVWEASPSSIWKAPYAIGMMETKSVEFVYNNIFEFFSVLNGTVMLPFDFGNITVGFMNVAVPDFSIDNSHIGFLAGYGRRFFNNTLSVGAHFNYYSHAIDVYKYSEPHFL